jgi:hypothetical protein
MKELFKFNTYFNDRLNEYINKIPENYNIFHYRLGDDELFKEPNKNYVNNMIELFKQHISQYQNTNCLIISDSFYFKQQLHDIYINDENINVFLNKPSHTADISGDKDDIDIFIDFSLIIHAKTINCHSIYSWISNFVYWSSIVYDIPCINLKLINH